ncbi:MAG: RagB/SusD family nutrient uptake outer membrane protein [Muribaculaceae bacterium]|nr:RagB/SusD family nutrient uptake outer membrane protein [Muribaculaceae bacterium]
MKNSIIKGLASVLAVASLASCSSDYLEVAPKTAVTANLVQTTESGAQDAMYGLARAMYYPYTGSDVMSILGVNGEPFIMMFYGDLYGQDYFSYLWGSQMGANFTWETNRSQASYVCQIGWMYCYNLISQANQILANIDNIDGNRDRLNFIKAQALTIRAHAYVRLLQIYGPRWEDSNNGEAYVCPLRLTPSTGNAPLEKMSVVIAAIKSDLDEALELYDARPNTINRSGAWEPDEDCARGVYARLGLLIHDYPVAQKMAKDARAPYQLLTAEQYKAGFADVQSSNYLWANPVAPTAYGLGYYAHGSYYACQGPYPTEWELGAGQINYELYRQIPKGDIRADLFFTPDKLTKPTQLRESSFWNENICNPANMNLTGNANMKIQLLQFGTKAIPGGDTKKFGQPYVSRSGEPTNPIIAFGAQYKFWGLDMYGTNSFPYMRAEEMLLTEAEAAYYNGDYATAKSCLNSLLELRNPGQTVDALSGDALLDQIKLQRRIELWGEGLSWFDLKRWNQPMIRNIWEAGNVNSNNIPASFKLEKQPTDPAWRFTVPQAESQYNTAIDRSLID